MFKWEDEYLSLFFIIITIISIIFALHYTFNLKKYFNLILDKYSTIIKQKSKKIKYTELEDIKDQKKGLIQKEDTELENKIDQSKGLSEKEDTELENIIDLNKGLSEKEDINIKKDVIKEGKKKENNELIEDEVIHIKLDIDIIFAFTFLGRILITIYSFHGIFFLYNFIFQNLALFANIFFCFDNIIIQLVIIIIYISISILTSNVLVIPMFEFLCFPFLKFKNPFCHLETFNYIYENKEFNSEEIKKKNNSLFNCFLFILSFFYILGFILAFFTSVSLIKNGVEFFILIFEYTYYLALYFSYIFISLIVLWRNPEEFEKHILPGLNLLSHSINPIYKDNYKENEKIKDKDIFFDTRNKLRKKLLGVTLIIIIMFSWKNKREYKHIIRHIIFIGFVFVLSITLNFPFCYKNNKTFGKFFSSEIRLKKEAMPKHPVMLSVIRFLSSLICISISSILCLSFFLMKEEQNEDLIDFNNLINIFENKIDSKYQLLPSICNSFIYNMPIYLYIPFMNDAYYYNNINEPNKNSSFDYPFYKKIFFDDDYIIDPIRNLTDGEKGVKMVQYNVKNKKKNINVTILSIKGTSIKEDIYMDLQLFMPSVFLNLLSTFSVTGNEMESFIYKIVEYSLSIPYRLFGEYFFIDQYINQLKDAYDKAYNNSSFLENVVVVGHSLGGGLSKILGRIRKIQAISLSGPGINAFHTNWTERGNSENFDLSFIDLVPDKDLIPRVEVSGGTIYRIICNQGTISCHSKTLSLCETLAMCRSRYYEFYCFKMTTLNSDEIREILKSSDLKRKNKK